MRASDDLISVIIPVYNVEPYLDQCIASVAAQTYRTLEIIVVYDESEDGSLAVCQKWERQDERIRLIVNARRGGLGQARNTGLDSAGGAYVLFVDSDDWMDEDYIEQMHGAALAGDVDFVSDCGYRAVFEDREECRWSLPPGTYASEKEKEILIHGDWVSMWKKLYRREWLVGRKLYQPAVFCYEDWGTFPAMVRAAKAVRVAPVAGMCYRVRENSLSYDNSRVIVEGYAGSMRHLMAYLRDHGLLKRDSDSIACYFYRDYITRHRLYRDNAAAIRALDEVKVQTLEAWFPPALRLERRCYLLGGFSLRWAYQNTTGFLEDTHLCFSSLIAMMSDGTPLTPKHPNPFRERQLACDNDGLLRRLIEDMNEDDAVLLDFTEERYDIAALSGGGYATCSEAFLESNLAGTDYTKISCGSAEFWELWEKSCRMLLTMLRRKIPASQVILVKNRLSERYGDLEKTCEFSDAADVRDINRRIGRMEEFFLSQEAGIRVIEPQETYRFSAPYRTFGVQPQYMNGAYYAQTGLEIYKLLHGR